jgi:DNA-binding SARP family transcriptional activator
MWAGVLVAGLPLTCGSLVSAVTVGQSRLCEVLVIGIQVLGPLDVTVNGGPADAGGPRQRCVLARLIAGGGQVVSVDRLIEDLYAGEGPPRALAAVQSYVCHLRRALEPGRAARAPAQVLVTSPPGYALHLDRDAVDAWRFEDLVHQATGKDDPAAVHAQLAAALALWHGPAFHEFAGMPWADLEASRLDELRLVALERQADAALRLGRAAQAIPDLDSLAAEYPLREELWRLLALALYQCGRQGDALAALRRARARLAAELGIDPGPALRTLEADIFDQAPHLVEMPAPVPKPPATVISPVRAELYVGRDAELSQVARSAAEAAAGRMRIALVSGEAGAGKTALTHQVWARLPGQGWTAAAGRCPEHDGAPAGWPWSELIRQLASTTPPADPEPLAPLLAGTGPAEDDVAAARFRMHRAIAGYLGVVSRSAPLLLVLDDLHHADAETLAILADITTDLAASTILMLVTYRETEAGEPLTDCLAALARHQPARIRLGGLTAAAAAELFRTTCQRPVDDETVHAITGRTEGNPFFIREIARLLDSEGALAATTEVPAGVRDVLQRRIARLPATAQTILRQAAVIGRETDIDTLAEVSGAQEPVVLDAIEAGLLTGLLAEPGTGRIRFTHALVRDTLYEGLSRLRRSRLHARAAQAIERHSPAEVAALAHHHVAAGTDPGKAAHYSRLAAEQAEQRFAFHEAARMWEQAISCLDKTGDAPVRERLELVLSLVRALTHTGQWIRARAYRRDAVRSALPLQDPSLLARVITAFDVATLWTSQEYGLVDDELVETVERTLEQLPPGDQPPRCRLLTTLAFELDGAESERGYQVSAQAAEMARRIGDPATLTMALNARYFQTFRHGGLDERQRLGAELLAMRGKPVTAEALAHLMLMQAHCGGASLAAADLHAAEAAHIADRYDLPTIATRVGFYRALRTALSGDFSAATERYRQAAGQMNKLGMWQHGAGLCVLGLFCVRAQAGRLADSVADLEQLYNYAPWSGFAAEGYALTLAASGRTTEARAVAAQPRPIRRDAFWLFMTGVRGLLAVAIDDRQRADSAYRALLPYAGRPLGADTAVMTLWPGAQILGDLARYLGLPSATAHFQHALTIAEQAKVQPWAQAARKRLSGGPSS